MKEAEVSIRNPWKPKKSMVAKHIVKEASTIFKYQNCWSKHSERKLHTPLRSFEYQYHCNADSVQIKLIFLLNKLVFYHIPTVAFKILYQKQARKINKLNARLSFKPPAMYIQTSRVPMPLQKIICFQSLTSHQILINPGYYLQSPINLS